MNPEDLGKELGDLSSFDPEFPLDPTDELWFPDEDIPPKVLALMPKEENLEEAMGYLFPKGVPEGFGIRNMRGMANYRRQVIWKEFKEGKLEF